MTTNNLFRRGVLGSLSTMFVVVSPLTVMPPASASTSYFEGGFTSMRSCLTVQARYSNILRACGPYYAQPDRFWFSWKASGRG